MSDPKKDAGQEDPAKLDPHADLYHHPHKEPVDLAFHHHHHHPGQVPEGTVVNDKPRLSHSSVFPKRESDPTIIILVEDEISQVLEGERDQKTLLFKEKSRRAKFVRNVFLALGFQLAICSGSMLGCRQVPSLVEFFQTVEGASIAWICLFFWIFLLVAIGCCNVGRGKPNSTNIGLLILSTTLLSVSTAAISLNYSVYAIMLAAATTAAVVFALAFVVMCTPLDITSKLIYVVGIIFALILFSLIASIPFALGVYSISETGNIIQVCVSGCFAVIYVLLILIHLQLIVGGGAYHYESDDWLLASILLFFDILMFFLVMLGLARE